MKTQKSYTAILLLLTLLFAVALQASTTRKSESLNLLDTPPEVEGVSDNAVSPHSVDFYFEEEEYINDIPFNTKCVSIICKYEKAMSRTYVLKEEAYVDDIPFDTYAVAKNYNYKEQFAHHE